MFYFFGFLIFLILVIALPYKVLGAITVFFIISALIVQTTASFLSETKIPFLKSVKAVLYVLIFSIIAFIFTNQLAGALSAPLVMLLLPVLILFAQALAYSYSLDIPSLLGCFVISVCVTIVGWLVSLVFGLSFTSTLHLMS